MQLPLSIEKSWIDSREDTARRSPHRSPKTAPLIDHSNEMLKLETEYRVRHQYYKQDMSNETPNHKSVLKPLNSNEDGFPAILTLEDHGKFKNILVHNSKQLHDEINRARESKLRVEKIQGKDLSLCILL